MLQDDEAIAAQRLGQVVGGRWRLEELLGVGGMAAVYRASTPDGHVGAVKLLHPETSRKRDIRERFLREAYAANRMEHPGAVRVLEHGGGGEEPTFLVMELLTGETVGVRARRPGGIALDELLDMMDQVLDVLARAHELGVVHRDLKPDNLFITGEGRLKVLDFGLARLLDAAPGDYRTKTGTALGTVPYMAPEQALGRSRDIDGRADLFSLGATAFRILSGRRIHEAESEAELLVAMASKPAPPLATVTAGIPPPVCAVVDLALAFARDARYPDARTMQGDVRALRAGQSPPYATQNAAVVGPAERARHELPVLSPVLEPTRAERRAPVRPSATAPMPIVAAASPPPPAAPLPVSATLPFGPDYGGVPQPGQGPQAVVVESAAPRSGAPAAALAARDPERHPASASPPSAQPQANLAPLVWGGALLGLVLMAGAVGAVLWAVRSIGQAPQPVAAPSDGLPEAPASTALEPLALPAQSAPPEVTSPSAKPPPGRARGRPSPSDPTQLVASAAPSNRPSNAASVPRQAPSALVPKQPTRPASAPTSTPLPAAAPAAAPPAQTTKSTDKAKRHRSKTH